MEEEYFFKTHRNGLVYPKNYEVYYWCMQGGINFSIIHKNKKVTWFMTEDDLKTKQIHTNKKVFTSTFRNFVNPITNDNTYALIGYRIPKKVLEESQGVFSFM